MIKFTMQMFAAAITPYLVEEATIEMTIETTLLYERESPKGTDIYRTNYSRAN